MPYTLIVKISHVRFLMLLNIVDNKSLCLINERIFILSGAHLKTELKHLNKKNVTCPGLFLNSSGRV